ncbi:cobalamin synthase [Sphingobacterium sp. 2149]|nr:cobalamin synthase [Sphingobacterium sp. 2149]
MYVLFINSVGSYLLASFLIVGAVLLYKGFYHLARRIQE